MWCVFTVFSFIEKYGTHVITSLQVGGKDVIYVKQHRTSPCSNLEVQKLMETMAEKRFTGQSNGYNAMNRPGKDKVRESRRFHIAKNLKVNCALSSQTALQPDLAFEHVIGSLFAEDLRSNQEYLFT